MWKRGCNEFYRENDWGNRIEEKPDDKCTFVTSTNPKVTCPDAMMQCIEHGSCADFLSMAFNATSTGSIDVKKAVMAINPHTAIRLLGRLGFGSYLADPQPGKMRHYMVQSIESWEDELRNMTKPDACDCMRRMVRSDVRKELLKVLDSTRGPAFREYLKVLIEWVNANPTVLNPNSYEVTQSPANIGQFVVHTFQDGSKAINVNLYRDYCDINRVQSAIMNNILTNIKSTTGVQVGGADTSNLDSWWKRISQNISDADDKMWVEEQLEKVRSSDSDFKPQETLAFLDRIKTILGKKLMSEMIPIE